MIREWLRDWLGVSDRLVAARVKDDIAKQVGDDAIKVVIKAVVAAFEGWQTKDYGTFGHTADYDVVTSAIDRAVAKRQETEIVRHIKSESFIDEVVERIRRKQV